MQCNDDSFNERFIVATKVSSVSQDIKFGINFDLYIVMGPSIKDVPKIWLLIDRLPLAYAVLGLLQTKWITSFAILMPSMFLEYPCCGLNFFC